ncbi:peptidoglycan D,D-transpeptidase FtsI family protein [Psychrobacter sp. AOP22-C1-22]|uniref:peptidoglycan D,D-transpeptidase FtsI family protein n=1 Tax=unclassified Psychrobacter TaxID=196806 RepID=UPI0017885A36|nr:MULTISPECIES: penicillin-binding protein 2 [unclassified Psychrobacter]MDN5800939.1 penicillin-binding protein 2 [Psychrobacter sp.]MBE0407641.1 penicillin-binding protein 2 [Psychrobacter sp. FME6]MBE0444006.1 penicillin-binding protein 2 [Psychrobacter sp. FME5]MDN5891314.1 penicillin-binding protein 2 [Psychrobacter sp.]MDN5897099.1 penicillin-binding protein 2 [Psychrobacter sp.]
MSEKKSKSKTGKDSVKNTNKKSASGKVTKPLRRASAAKSGQTSSKPNNKSAENRKAKLFGRLKNNEDQGAYTSVKNRKSKMVFSSKASGASSRGGFEQDKNRFRTVWGLALIILAALIGRAYYLQVANAQFYQDKGNELITSVRTQKSYRGMITDRNDLPLAVSAPLATVSFSPHDYAREYYELKRIIITNPNSPQLISRMQKRLDNMDLTQLAASANISVSELKRVTAIDDSIDVTDEAAVKAALPSGAGSHYLPLLNKVTPEIAQSVSSLDFPGVYEKNFFQRYYPQPQPNSQLLGFMGQNASDPDGGYEGRAGVERLYETELAGEDGKVLVLKDAKQNSLKEIKQVEPEVPGKNVALTIDSRLQYLLYKELEKAGRLQKARWSTGMVVDVQTGEVLALSTWPSFNSNNLNEMTGENQRNRALLDVFEPGSVMKPFTVAAALDSGKYTTTSLIDTNPGSIRVRGYTIRDHNNLGMINMATLIQKSSNVASTKIALSLPADGITNMQKKFGFGAKTPLQFPGEGSGLVVTPKEKETSRRATVSYGYGIQVTLAQVAQAYSALAAGGVMHPLTLIKDDKSQPSKRIMAHEQAMSIVQMMEGVTETGGTAKGAAIDGYRVAGKTGTSRRINPKGGYYTDQYRNVFAGMAPASNPRLVGVMLIEDPRGQIYAGLTVAPVFHNVMKEALRLYNVPLDKPLKTEDP